MGVRVRALMDVFYAGQDRKTGDEFDTVDENDQHALALMAAGRVVKVEAVIVPEKRGRYRHRAMRAEK